MTVEPYRCAHCEGEMGAVVEAARHTYECDDCGSRSVIVPKGGGEVFRYDLPHGRVAIPHRGEPLPKGLVHYDPVGGQREQDESARSALQAVNEIVPGGVSALLSEEPEVIAKKMIAQLEDKKKPTRLGDIVAATTKKFGVEPCEECLKRKDKLNAFDSKVRGFLGGKKSED